MGALPEHALISPVMLERAPALPLLIWLYGALQPGERDVEFSLAEAGREILGGTPYGTMRRWWALLSDAPCFSAVRNARRGGLLVTFRDEWIDRRWREYEITNDLISQEEPDVGDGNEIANDLISTSGILRNEITNERITRNEIRSDLISCEDRVSDHDLRDYGSDLDHEEIRERAETRGSTSREMRASAPAQLLTFPARAEIGEPPHPAEAAPVGNAPKRNTPSGDPNQRTRAVRYLVEQLGGRTRPNAFQASLIAGLVPDGDADALERWRACVDVQLAAGKKRVDWMIERFKTHDDRAAALKLRERLPRTPPAAPRSPSRTPAPSSPSTSSGVRLRGEFADKFASPEEEAEAMELLRAAGVVLPESTPRLAYASAQ